MNIKAGHTNKIFKQSRVLWVLSQHCSCFTSPRAGVSLPGSSLNISHHHSLLGSLREKGNHNKLCSATSPYFPLPSPFLFLPCLSLSLSLHSHPRGFIYLFIFSQPLALSLRPSIPCLRYHLLPSSLVRVVMGLKDVCDVIQTDCRSVSGMPLPQLLPAPASCPSSTSTHLHPAVSVQTCGGISSVLLCLSGSAALVFHLSIEDVCSICQLLLGQDL